SVIHVRHCIRWNRDIANANSNFSVRRSHVHHSPLVGITEAKQSASDRPTLGNLGCEGVLEWVLKLGPANGRLLFLGSARLKAKRVANATRPGETSKGRRQQQIGGCQQSKKLPDCALHRSSPMRDLSLKTETWRN